MIMMMKKVIFCGKIKMFEIGNIIKYGFYDKIKIIGEDKYHFILQDKNMNEKKIHKSLIHKYAKKVSQN